MSTPRRPCPRSSVAPMIAISALRAHAENLTGRAATLSRRGEVAQLVEHTAENRGVAGSIPALAIFEAGRFAAMELAFLSAVEQARLVRSGEVVVRRARPALARTDRAARPDAERVRHRLRRGSARHGARASTRHPATRRSAAFRSRSRTSPRPQASARPTRRAPTPTTSRTSTPPSSDESAKPDS